MSSWSALPVAAGLLVLAVAAAAAIAAWGRREFRRDLRLLELKTAGRVEEVVGLALRWADERSLGFDLVERLVWPGHRLSRLAGQLRDLGRWEQSVAMFDRVLREVRRRSVRVVALNDRGAALLNLGRLAEAEASFRDVLRLSRAAVPVERTVHAYALRNLAALDLQRGRFQGVLDRLADAGGSGLHRDLLEACARLWQGETDAVLRLVEKSPPLPDSLVDAEVLQKARRTSAGRTTMNALLEYTADTLRAHLWAAGARAALASGASGEIEKFLSAPPAEGRTSTLTRFSWLPLKLLLLQAAGRPGEASSVLAEIDSLSSLFEDARHARACVALDLSSYSRRAGDADHAWEHAASAAALAPTPLLKHAAEHELGCVQEVRGRAEDARDAFRRCAEGGIESFLARDARSRLGVAKGR